jgi:hypothetical protein
MVVVPYDDAVGGENFQCGLGVGFDALVGWLPSRSRVGVGELVRWGEEESCRELWDACGGEMAKEGKAG